MSTYAARLLPMRSRARCTLAQQGRPTTLLACRSAAGRVTSSRRLMSSATSSAQPALYTHARLSPNAEADAKQLRALFDAPPSASASSSSGSLGAVTGLFRLPSLAQPADFIVLAQRTLLRAQLLVSRIERAPEHGPEEMRGVVRLLDRLSDTLCAVIDAAELIRNAHPEEQWVEAANEAYESLCGYMNVLNTHTGLYNVISRVLEDPSLRASLSQEALAVALVFQRDFEKSGIHLPPAARSKFVDLSDSLLVLGRKFYPPQRAAEPHVLPQDWLKGLPPQVATALAGVKRKAGAVQLPACGWEAQAVLRYAPDERARRVAYAALYAAPREQIETLEEMLRKRLELAELTGYANFSEMTLGDKMARRPENVTEFLGALTEHHRPHVQRNLDQLKALKQREASSSGASQTFNAWDREYFAMQYTRNLSRRGSMTPIATYFSAGTVFAGLSRLFSCLYGLRFRSASTQNGEAWASDVHRIEVVDENDEAVGVIYADLFARDGKPPSAAHYTVRCSRRIDADDLEGDFKYGILPDGRSLDAREYEAAARPLEAEATGVQGKQGLFQLPVVALVCDFVRPSAETGPSLLSWSEVETLFHEMGHALHSMLGRTEYHNVSGTRCATDFVELPSILMEHFVACPSVVDLVASHHRTNASLPYSELAAHMATARSLESLDTHHQILLASLDQLYHSRAPAESSFDSTTALCGLHDRVGILPSVSGVPAQAHFGHLVGYGAVYYSYLFDRTIANRVWAKLFKADPLDREAGEKLKNSVLKHGGGRDPWEMLAELLEDDDIARGGPAAMQTVGSWGIPDAGVKPA